jgi:membrane associated rhomboid family serine protease
MIPYKDINPTRRFPWVTVALIAANFLVFGYELGLDDVARRTFFYQFGAVPRLIVYREPVRGIVPPIAPLWTIFTAMFVHGGLLHVGGNMLYLWIFGNNVEDRLGRVKFLFFYFVCGLAAAAAQILIAPGSAAPIVGASGAIAGVLGGYLVKYPFARIRTLVFIFLFITVVELPAMVVLGLWFVLQLFQGALTVGVQTAGSSGVAFFAHIGGFVTGMILIGLFAGRPRRSVSRWG